VEDRDSEVRRPGLERHSPILIRFLSQHLRVSAFKVVAGLQQLRGNAGGARREGKENRCRRTTILEGSERRKKEGS